MLERSIRWPLSARQEAISTPPSSSSEAPSVLGKVAYSGMRQPGHRSRFSVCCTDQDQGTLIHQVWVLSEDWWPVRQTFTSAPTFMSAWRRWKAKPAD